MIRKKLVFVKQDLKSREEAIAFIANAIETEGLLNDKQEFIKAVFKREKEISTSIGNGIAIPHGKTDAVNEIFISYVGIKKPFEWDENTKDKIKGIFLIGVPEKKASTLHLKAISEISKKLINDKFREALFACQEDNEAFDLLNTINGNF